MKPSRGSSACPDLFLSTGVGGASAEAGTGGGRGQELLGAKCPLRMHWVRTDLAKSGDASVP